MNSIMVVSDGRWTQHRILLYHIWETIKHETLWQGYKQTVIPCNDKLINNNDDFADYYIQCMENWSWEKDFVIKLNFRDCWGKIYSSREWSFKEII